MRRKDRRLKALDYCARTRKSYFRSEEAANIKRDRIIAEGGPLMRVYFCLFCGGFHLTSQANKRTLR